MLYLHPGNLPTVSRKSLRLVKGCDYQNAQPSHQPDRRIAATHLRSVKVVMRINKHVLHHRLTAIEGQMFIGHLALEVHLERYSLLKEKKLLDEPLYLT